MIVSAICFSYRVSLAASRLGVLGGLLLVSGFGSVQADEPIKERTDLFISGVYPHLTTYGVYSQEGAHNKPGHDECGIGAVVPWAGKLWMVNYAPHQPRGSEHKLFSISPHSDAGEESLTMTVHPESVGGTPAGRMIHAESKQLFIAHYAIDAEGNVRAISPQEMPIRVTAITRHLHDPANMVYYVDMEGSIWEANVHTLAVKRLFKKPVPGWHGKGAYVSQGRLVVSNNGELSAGSYEDLLVGGKATDAEERGVLAEYDGKEWRIVERRQYTDVTGPSGIAGGSNGKDPVWAIGWDRRSVRLKLLEEGKWFTYLLPKAAYCNDASHGWYTEWPRIREITDGRWMMDMHGMFYDFPPEFSSKRSAGIRPIGSHLRYVPDFCAWNDRLVLATDETSIQGNPLAGQPQSNLWFGQYEDLRQWGPASGYGGPWIEDAVKADTPSDPFLIAGFDRRYLHLAVGKLNEAPNAALRAADQLPITSMPPTLARLPRVAIPRGDWHQKAPGFAFTVDQPVRVYLSVDQRGETQLTEPWTLTDETLVWNEKYHDAVYQATFPAGNVVIPGNDTEHTPGAYGMPHLAFVETMNGEVVKIAPASTNPSIVVVSPSPTVDPANASESVAFTLQVDRTGDGKWSDLQTVKVDRYYGLGLPEELDAVWLRLKTDRDCVATAFLHQTADHYQDGTAQAALFAGLADVGQPVLAARVYPAKRNRNLRMITADQRYFEFTKSQFQFVPDAKDDSLNERLEPESDWTVDAASVVVRSQGRTWRLPKGDAAFDRSVDGYRWRGVREVESERELANLHGTFYELPLVTNGAPPAWNLMRPVASHHKQITDFCTWNGLLVLAGVRDDAAASQHVFTDPAAQVGLWFGGIDDLWKLGKPVGQGGPWLQSSVRKDIPSDPYLMRGYDQKELRLSHESSGDVRITIQVDIDGTGLWVDYDHFTVAARQTLTHRFPSGFSACWLRAVSDQDTTATAQLDYR